MKPAKAEMLMMASIQSMTSPQRKAPVCGAGACSGIQFVLVDFVPKKGKPRFGERGFQSGRGSVATARPSGIYSSGGAELITGSQKSPSIHVSGASGKGSKKNPGSAEAGFHVRKRGAVSSKVAQSIRRPRPAAHPMSLPLPGTRLRTPEASPRSPRRVCFAPTFRHGQLAVADTETWS